MLISTALLLDSNIRNSVCTPAKLPCRRVEVGYEKNLLLREPPLHQIVIIILKNKEKLIKSDVMNTIHINYGYLKKREKKNQKIIVINTKALKL
jgi:hypothetical protein